MLTGMGSLSYGELAGQRIRLGLMLNDPEEEHDCFSDNTHNSHYYNVVGMRAIYSGAYKRIDGREVKGASLSALIAKTAPVRDKDMIAKLDATFEAMTKLKQRAETTERYDQMLGDGNAAGNATVQEAIDRLTEQTKSLERIVGALKLDQIKFEGSDSLDSPDKVKKK
jgi:putative iron-regulated protein